MLSPVPNFSRNTEIARPDLITVKKNSVTIHEPPLLCKEHAGERPSCVPAPYWLLELVNHFEPEVVAFQPFLGFQFRKPLQFKDEGLLVFEGQDVAQ